MARAYRYILDLLGDDFGGTPNPPGSGQTLDFGEPDDNGRPMYYARTSPNQGHEIWIGAHGLGWQVFYRRPDALRLAWFIFWDWWAVGMWFGWKRKIWYWALNKDVASWRSEKVQS